MKKIFVKRLGAVAVVAALIGGAVVLYLFNMPHRDVQKTEAYAELSAVALVNEFLADAPGSNDKYLSDEGDSKVLIISGTVGKVESDQKGQAVVVLSDSTAPASVRCSFSLETSDKARSLAKGDAVRIKGVIRSGASKDEDLGLYEDVIVEKCDLVSTS